MKTDTLLVELGTEELPPRALKTLSQSFTEGVLRGLENHRLAHGAARGFASPRRLAVLVEALQLEAEDEQVEVLGPPAERARDDAGHWTPAAQGFARKHGIEPDALDVTDTDKGPRLVYRTTRPGASVEECLEGIIEQALKDLPIPKRMRWGSSRREFVRPVHWLVAMLGKSVVNCNVLELAAGNRTRGHRFLGKGEIPLKQAKDYEAALEKAKVIADFQRRRDLIRHQVEEAAAALGATADLDDDLLDEVTALVEWPVALAGSFEKRFLEVPPEALVSSMKEHQKYFPVRSVDGQLLPHFIFVSNIESKDPAIVIDGNERVIRPRLADADFFFSSDKQESLASRVERLGDIVFQQRLGTLLDKTRRLQSLAIHLAPAVGADAGQAERAALLSKTDLLTQMVGEFPDLQGIAGRYYALNDGEPAPVAEALQQQYWPAFAGDNLPEGPVATALALADRVDTLVGIFGIGQPPTGSRDPFALRRAALGVLRILVEKALPMDLRELLSTAANGYVDGVIAAGTVEEVLAYMLERMRAWYEDAAIPVEVFKAVSARGVSVPLDFDHRVKAVHSFTALPQAVALAAANKRVSNILSKQASDFKPSGVSEGLLTEAAERLLAEEVAGHRPVLEAHLAAGEYTAALSGLADLQEPVDRFFDEVMVMDEDEAVRDNRLNLLNELRQLFLQVADISQLAPAR